MIELTMFSRQKHRIAEGLCVCKGLGEDFSWARSGAN